MGRKLLLSVAGALVLFAAACEKEEPVPDRVALSGDSITLQAILYAQDGANGWDTEEKVGLGWTARDIIPRVDQDVQGVDTSPEVLIVALGHNDAMKDGSFTQERQEEAYLLAWLPHEDACTVLVKPHYAGTDPLRTANIEDYRDWVDDLVDSGPEGRYVSVDWRPVVQAHPEYVGEDGFHLWTPDEWPTEEVVPGADAYTDLMADGVDECLNG